MKEIIVTRKYQITIPRDIREKLGIKVGDRLLIRLEGERIILEPIRPRDALSNLATIADRILKEKKKIDAVKLVEESLERETGFH